MSENSHENDEVRHVTDDLLEKSPAVMTETEKIATALDFATAWGRIDGDHHKMWTIDQIVRVLTGCPVEKSAVKTDTQGTRYTYDYLGESEAYDAFVTAHEDGEDGPQTYSWDTGIAP